MNQRRRKEATRRDYHRRLADLKDEPKETGCRAWIAKINHYWKWSSPGHQQLPNPFRN